jgi:DNA-binding transcriptional MerR regulator/effector-binding domain-containing protein
MSNQQHGHVPDSPGAGTRPARLFSIGELARLGEVSVRMLRHYDEIGLLKPTAIHKRTNYRSYGADDLGRLRRIVALKGLGFSLQQVALIVDERVSPEELRGMLRLRKAELMADMTQTQMRFQEVERMIVTIERENAMSTDSVANVATRKRVEAFTAVELSAVAANFFDPGSIGPVLSPLYPQMFELLGAAGVSGIAPPIAYYTDTENGEGIMVHAAVAVDSSVTVVPGLTVVHMPAIDAVSFMHYGPMAMIGQSYEEQLAWIAEQGLATNGYSREVYLDCPPDQNDWVTELQFAVVPLGA